MPKLRNADRGWALLRALRGWKRPTAGLRNAARAHGRLGLALGHRFRSHRGGEENHNLHGHHADLARSATHLRSCALKPIKTDLHRIDVTHERPSLSHGARCHVIFIKNSLSKRADAERGCELDSIFGGWIRCWPLDCGAPAHQFILPSAAITELLCRAIVTQSLPRIARFEPTWVLRHRCLGCRCAAGNVAEVLC
jgi:hypothetical protein